MHQELEKGVEFKLKKTEQTVDDAFLATLDT